MTMRGIRGAITVEEDKKEEIWSAARHLVTKILSKNELRAENVGAMIFSLTGDLKSGFPSSAVRKLPKLRLVPVFDTLEPAIDESLEKCIRVLVLADVEKPQNEIRHVYLGKARNLRPDLDQK